MVTQTTRQESGRATERTRFLEVYLKQIEPEGKLTTAKRLHRQKPDMFPSVEIARSAIRTITLSNGNRQRDRKHHLEHLTIEIDSKEDLSWQTPFIIPSGITEMAVMGDFHGCYMNQGAVNEALSVSSGVKTLLINGDLLDNTWLSRWAKDKDAPIPETEFYAINTLIEQLAKRFNKIFFKSGNHDNWLKRYVGSAIKEGTQKVISDKIEEAVRLENFIRFKDFNIEQIHNLQEIRFGDLSILHGHEKAGAGSPIHLAQNILTWWQRYEKRWDVKILVNHHHWRDQAVKTNFDERIGKAWTNGCLCDVMPKYNPYGRHNHGIAIATQNNGIADVKLFEV